MDKKNKKLRLLMGSMVVVILIISGCVEQKPQNNKLPNIKSINTTSGEIFFPKQLPTTDVDMDALLKGRLVIVDGCLRANGHLLVWPPYGYSVSTENGITIVVDDTGKLVARAGDMVKVGGGEETDSNIDVFSSQLPDVRCQGPYWIVGGPKAIFVETFEKS